MYALLCLLPFRKNSVFDSIEISENKIKSMNKIFQFKITSVRTVNFHF